MFLLALSGVKSTVLQLPWLKTKFPDFSQTLKVFFPDHAFPDMCNPAFVWQEKDAFSAWSANLQKSLLSD